ncbi:aminopeptidase [Rhodovulum sulfidophilum]|uniref:Aminopeptidase n=1 Tax=Rhodovulum sulfidophilum TaxID=35806 RepID=A0A0D6B5Q9_RHOSU|nr:aminopeptidase [Rhodovulum sulfidophilum]
MAAPDLNLTTKEPFSRGSHPCMARYNGEGYPGAACCGRRMGDTIPASRGVVAQILVEIHLVNPDG